MFLQASLVIGLPSPAHAAVKDHYDLRSHAVGLGIREELFVVTVERQFAHEGPRIIARAAGEIGRGAR